MRQCHNCVRSPPLPLQVLLVVFCLICLLTLPPAQCFQQELLISITRHKPSTRLVLPLLRKAAASSEEDDPTQNPTKQQQRAKGVYVRPSAVIEKGSGFFFPGLEGPRVRLFVGTCLLLVTAINHVASANNSGFSEVLAIVFSLLVLLQGAIEALKDSRIETIAKRQEQQRGGGNSSSNTQQQQLLCQAWASPWTTATDDSIIQRDKVEWAAASFVSLTPATHMILLERDNDNNNKNTQPTIPYWLGVTPTPPLMGSSTSQEQGLGVSQAIAAALDTIQKSKGGRVALPADHPAVVGLMDDPRYRRCVILQQVPVQSANTGTTTTTTRCWMVASDDLLASFTKGDLQWLGQLATYVS
jgi:hypothetical protein